MSTRPGRRQQPVRERVLRAARQLFTSRGYDGLQATVVCGAASVSRSQLHQLFPDRRSLLSAILAPEVGVLVDRLTVAIPVSASVDEMLDTGFRVFVDFVEERQPEYGLLFGEAGRLEPDAAALLQGLRENLASAYVSFFRPAVEAAGIAWPSDAEARLVAHSVIALAEGAVQSWLSDPTLPKEKMIRVTTHMMRRALIGPPRA